MTGNKNNSMKLDEEARFQVNLGDGNPQKVERK